MKAVQVFLLFLLGIFVISLVGCSSSNPAQSSQNQPSTFDQATAGGQNVPSNPAGPPSGGYNNTASRDAMRQNSIDACNGMNENDSCQLTFGNRTISGACRSFNDTLSCAPAGGSTSGRMRGNFTRSGNYTRYQSGGQ